MNREYRTLRRDENQALGLGRYAIDFLNGAAASLDDAVYERIEQFDRDSVACGVSALALQTNAPTVLRAEAREYPAQRPAQNPSDAPARGATLFGSRTAVAPEKA